MTYCVSMLLDSGLVFLSDSRTSAGVDQINTFRKTTVFEIPGERVIVMLSAGNLAISQGVMNLLAERLAAQDGHAPTLHNCPNMFEAARCIGDALREMHMRDGEALKAQGVEFNASFIVGGQIKGEPPRLFQLYSAGNFIEATRETCYFQIGESKYGKPVLDRMITPATPLDEAAKCALVSMDSTLKSNLSVGLPLDLLVYEANRYQTDQLVCIDEHNPYFHMIRSSWGQKLRQVFESLDDLQWGGGDAQHPLCVTSSRYERMRKITHPGEKIV